MPHSGTLLENNAPQSCLGDDYLEGYAHVHVQDLKWHLTCVCAWRHNKYGLVLLIIQPGVNILIESNPKQ